MEQLVFTYVPAEYRDLLRFLDPDIFMVWYGPIGLLLFFAYIPLAWHPAKNPSHAPNLIDSAAMRYGKHDGRGMMGRVAFLLARDPDLIRDAGRAMPAEPLVRGLAEHPAAVAAANYVARPHAHHPGEPGEPTAERFLETDAFRSAVPAERVLQEQLRKASLPGVPARVLEVALILYMLVGALWGYVDVNTTEDADFGFILSFLTVMFGSCGVIIVLMRRRRLLRTEPVHRFRAELPAAALPPEHVRTLALAATLASRSPADAWAGDPDLARNMGLTGEEEHLAAADKRRRRGERRGSRRAHASGATAPR
ncbi:hypothetical protein [Corynebacterium sp. 335C]